jgi:hypothetical protein
LDLNDISSRRTINEEEEEETVIHTSTYMGEESGRGLSGAKILHKKASSMKLSNQ